jgi:Ras-related protein Rab-11B
MNTSQFLVRIVMIGESGVGKSNLLNRFTNNGFSFDNKSTLGMEMGSCTVTLDSGASCQAQIWDTAGQERFKSMAISYFRYV